MRNSLSPIQFLTYGHFKLQSSFATKKERFETISQQKIFYHYIHPRLGQVILGRGYPCRVGLPKIQALCNERDNKSTYPSTSALTPFNLSAHFSGQILKSMCLISETAHLHTSLGCDYTVIIVHLKTMEIILQFNIPVMCNIDRIKMYPIKKTMSTEAQLKTL